MLCGLSHYLVNGGLSVGVQCLAAQVKERSSKEQGLKSLGKASVTLGKLQEESERTVNIEDNTEGHRGSGSAAKLRLRKPVLVGHYTSTEKCCGHEELGSSCVS